MNNKGSNIEPSGTPVWICDKSDSIKKILISGIKNLQKSMKISYKIIPYWQSTSKLIFYVSYDLTLAILKLLGRMPVVKVELKLLMSSSHIDIK